MALTISNNGAVQAASYHLGKAQQGFDISLRRLSSGKKILDRTMTLVPYRSP